MNVLIRGMSSRIHKRLQKRANQRDESFNKMLLDMIKDAVDRVATEEEKRREQEEAFQRLRELREQIYRRHGLLDDSTKIIREFRDQRNQ